MDKLFAIINTEHVDGHCQGMTPGLDYIVIDFGEGLHSYEVLDIAESVKKAEAMIAKLFKVFAPRLQRVTIIEGSGFAAPCMN